MAEIEKPTKENEHTIATFRRHWILLFYPAFTAFTLLMAAIFIILIQESLPITQIQATSIALTFIAFSIYLFAKLYIIWANEIYQITNVRIFHAKIQFSYRIKKEQVLFSLVKTVDEIRPSITSQILNYGHIKIGTDYHEKEAAFILNWIGNTSKIMTEINKLIS